MTKEELRKLTFIAHMEGKELARCNVERCRKYVDRFKRSIAGRLVVIKIRMPKHLLENDTEIYFLDDPKRNRHYIDSDLLDPIEDVHEVRD